MAETRTKSVMDDLNGVLGILGRCEDSRLRTEQRRPGRSITGTFSSIIQSIQPPARGRHEWPFDNRWRRGKSEPKRDSVTTNTTKSRSENLIGPRSPTTKTTRKTPTGQTRCRRTGTSPCARSSRPPPRTARRGRPMIPARGASQAAAATSAVASIACRIENCHGLASMRPIIARGTIDPVVARYSAGDATAVAINPAAERSESKRVASRKSAPRTGTISRLQRHAAARLSRQSPANFGPPNSSPLFAVDASPVPEPSAAWLAVAGGGSLLLLMRVRRATLG
jgi:hypothetical protein